jgi:rubrerythrin
MQIYRCRICGDVFVGKDKPSDCPFCGVPEKYLIPGNEWADENQGVELTDVSRKNLEAALKLELGATSLYACISETSNDMAMKSMFKGFSKVEREHASLLGKILKIPKGQLEKIEAECRPDDKAMLQKTAALEDNAVKEYIRGASEATEQRVKDIFTGLAAAEKGHLVLAKEMLGEK